MSRGSSTRQALCFGAMAVAVGYAMSGSSSNMTSGLAVALGLSCAVGSLDWGSVRPFASAPRAGSETSVGWAGDDDTVMSARTVWMRTTAWERVSWLVLGGLLTWSYGFNNIPTPIPGFPLPLVDFVLVGLLVVTRRHWIGFAKGNGRAIAGALILLLLLSVLRLALDVPTYGPLAFRDSLFAIEALGVLVGVSMARQLPRPACERIMQAVFVVASAWLALYPVKDAIQAASPVVGVQKSVPLLAFTSAGIVAGIAMLWFLDDRSWRSRVFTAVAAGTVLLAQMRGVYLALPLALLVRAIMGRASRGTSGGAAVGKAAVPVLVALAVLSVVPVPGRLGVAGPDLVVEQLSTLAGESGAGSGSLRAREDWWPRVIDTVEQQPLGPLVGVGFGPDLLDGYEGPDGSKVRKPHNDFLEIWARMGWIGLGVWLLLLTKVIRRLLAVARTGDRIAIWALSAQPVFLIVAFSQPLFAFAYGGLVYFVLCGIALGGSPGVPGSSTTVEALQARSDPKTQVRAS